MSVVGPDVLKVAGSVQLCAGQEAGSETAVHVMHAILEGKHTQAVILVDAQNAFNLLNQQLALLNIHRICPSIATVLTNLYRKDANLYLQKETVQSSEAVMQGDSLAMAMFALGITPLIRTLKTCHQIWFADDASAGGTLEEVHHWWVKLLQMGPKYRYHANPKKTWLLVKEGSKDNAQEQFQDSGINIATSGQKHLDAALGNAVFTKEYISAKVSQWKKELESLCIVAERDPHATSAALTHALISRWQYVMRTVPNISHLLTPLEEIIRHKMTTLLTGRDNITDEERQLRALPCNLDGMGLINPTTVADEQFESSQTITSPLVSQILEMKYGLKGDLYTEMKSKKAEITQRRKTIQESSVLEFLDHLTGKLKRNVQSAQEKGASIWLTSLPLENHGFDLNRSEFQLGCHCSQVCL